MSSYQKARIPNICEAVTLVCRHAESLGEARGSSCQGKTSGDSDSRGRSVSQHQSGLWGASWARPHESVTTGYLRRTMGDRRHECLRTMFSTAGVGAVSCHVAVRAGQRCYIQPYGEEQDDSIVDHRLLCPSADAARRRWRSGPWAGSWQCDGRVLDCLQITSQTRHLVWRCYEMRVIRCDELQIIR